MLPAHSAQVRAILDDFLTILERESELDRAFLDAVHQMAEHNKLDDGRWVQKAVKVLEAGYDEQQD